jgi:hypothetical protein
MDRPREMYAVNIFWAGICLGDRMLDTLSYGDDMLKGLVTLVRGSEVIVLLNVQAAGDLRGSSD